MMIATVDTNIIGHLYRSNTQFLISNLFTAILVDEQVKFELTRRCCDISHKFESDLADATSIYSEVTKQDLIDQKLLPLYQAQLLDMESLFLPSDEGEKRAIALAKTKGIFFLLTDDEKYMTGPTYMIDNGLITDMASLAFWDLIFLNVISDKLSYKASQDTYEFIASDGYIPDRYKGTYKSKINQSIRKLVNADWFRDWCMSNGITSVKIKDFRSYIKQLD